ncbi:type IV secretion system protein [Bordetella bronchialis]
MPILMLGIGPFFIAMLMFPATAKWFDSWFGQVITYISKSPW